MVKFGWESPETAMNRTFSRQAASIRRLETMPRLVGQQDDLEQYGGVVSRGARVVVLAAGAKLGQIEFVIDEVAQGVLEAAGLDLLVEVDRQQLQARVDRFEPRHPHRLPGDPDGLNYRLQR